MTLRKCFDQHQGRLVGKVDYFFDVYETHLQAYRETPVRLLEIGVDKGGSLELWRQYFGEKAEIHGIDINPEAAELAPPDSTVHIGSQADGDFLISVSDEHGPFDIVIDDGSHIMEHQKLSFETLYPRLNTQAIYICEDAFTSYWPEYGGGCGAEGTFMEYAKNLLDQLHADWQFADRVEPTPFTRTTRGIHFYSGTVVFEKMPTNAPAYSIQANGRSGDSLP